ncbi:MAG: glycine zipper 2TM domain-containing protein [Alphaproteobacteria bacterium]|nr:glycine zipper 2TM domain-containing protein [Alphaproteobacteria bacterium]
MNPLKLAVVGLSTLALVGCTSDAGTKDTLGTLLGGVVGTVVGAQFGSGTGQLAATAAGALLGGFLGSEIGRSLDRADRMAMADAEQQAARAPIGETIAWNNPESGNRGTVTPVREGVHRQTGQTCREFRQTVTIGSDTEEAVGTACLQEDGTWRIVSG